MLGRAIAIASEAFKNKFDKGGKPYILHCIRVMNSVSHLGEDVMSIAIMHDLIEDNEDWNIEKLKLEGFNMRVCLGMLNITHWPEDSYDEYIKKISLNEDSRQVKLADLRDNSDITRLKGISKKDLDRMEKYFKSYEYLKKV